VPERIQQGGAIWKRGLVLAVALFLLNLSLTFHNVWPTPWVTTRHELSVEIALLLAALALYSEVFRPPSRRIITWLAVLLTLLTVGRYAEVTAPALYGRPVNLYWDGRHLPRVAGMLAQVVPPWLVTVVVLGVVGLLAGVFWALRWALGRTWIALSHPLQRRTMGAVAGTLAALYLAGHLSPQFHTLRWFSLPVTATYAQQARFLKDALASGGAGQALAERRLPPSDLGRIAGADVFVVFLESYGAASFDQPAYADALAGSRQALAGALEKTGRQAVSAFVGSPTFGGGSWLVHASLLSGVEVRDNQTYDLLLTRDRETLVRRFAGHGHRALALMPGLRQEWPEGRFYGFDKIYGESALEYRGPEFGWWRIPDQYALARLDQMELSATPRSPIFLFYPTISSHMPFRPTPPYQDDWRRILTVRPFEADATASSLARKPEWTNLGPAYVDSLAYAFTYLAGYLEAPAPADLVLVLLGDHQPAASVSGEGAPWDVPVHVISNRRDILDTLVADGFEPGLTPRRPHLGAMHELTSALLKAFDSGTGLARGPGAPARSGPVEPGVDVAGAGGLGELADETTHLVGLDPVARRKAMALAQRPVVPVKAQ
jgi:phosphoglycerol transferase MdoB-like AlkP superfamily enzyme